MPDVTATFSYPLSAIILGKRQTVNTETVEMSGDVGTADLIPKGHNFKISIRCNQDDIWSDSNSPILADLFDIAANVRFHSCPHICSKGTKTPQ